MAEFTLEELAKLKGGAEKSPGGGGGFWTPENINAIVKNVRGLLQEYNAMRGGAPAPQAGQELAQGPPGPGQQLTAQGQGVTMPQLYSFGKQVLTNLEAQGYADKTPFEVLQAFTLTIKQLKGMIP